MRTNTYSLTLAVAAVLLLAGCTTTPTVGDAKRIDTPSPTPEVLSEAEAGDLYLSVVCPVNKALDEYDEANAGYSLVQDGNVEWISEAAAEVLETSEEAARTFDDTTIVWPENVADDITSVRDGYLTDMSVWSSIANAQSVEEMTGITFPDDSEAASAAQRIRLRLDLGADTTATCAEY